MHWAEQVVQQLAERAFDPSPIDASAKKILSEFKRTHADLWEEEHKRCERHTIVCSPHHSCYHMII